MSKLPQVSGAELIRALEKIGFVATRQRGSHVQLRKLDSNGKVTTFPVPVHAGRSLKAGTLRGIMRKANLETDDLLELL
ncbi:type II toxin-antitoxin system HicA family toxin [Candidatus Sumerlaeota bacterium]|nr:type II toxin-antitoxin system HicA family toxin [Candidatus Sumerlaeota bacterium]